MFDLRAFVMDTLRGMKDTEPEYKVRQYALSWYQKDVITLADLAEVESWYAEDSTPPSSADAESTSPVEGRLSEEESKAEGAAEDNGEEAEPV